jgi:FlaA1/EpsC-like NDP-sugar epimerase
MTIETNFGTRSETGVWSLNFLLLFVVLEIVALYSLRVYRRVWSRAALREFFLVALALTTAALITSSIWAISKKDVTWADFRCGFIGSQLAMWLVLLPRAFPEAIRELAVDSKHRQLVRKAKGRKQILVYGAGTRGNLFIGYLKSCAPEEFQHFQIAGFLDENPKLRGRVLQGFKIFGNLDGMEKLTRTHSLHGIMITITHMSDEAMARVFEMAYRLNLKVYRWHVDGLPQEVNMEEIKLPKVV